MIGIELPTLNTNDSSYTLVEWLVPDGSSIEGEEPLAVVETSKASEEIESTGPGILHVLVGGGQDCRPGQTIAYLFESADERDSYRGVGRHPRRRHRHLPGAEPRHHQRARALADRHGVSEAELRGLSGARSSVRPMSRPWCSGPRRRPLPSADCRSDSGRWGRW